MEKLKLQINSFKYYISICVRLTQLHYTTDLRNGREFINFTSGTSQCYVHNGECEQGCTVGESSSVVFNC
jgi:hypothetical protein